MQQGRRGPARHAPKAIGGAAGYPLKEGEHGMDPRFSLQGLHQVHLRRAGVGEHVIHPRPSQRAHERRSAITQTLPRFLGHTVPSPVAFSHRFSRSAPAPKRRTALPW